jgi:hypothetical protein
MMNCTGCHFYPDLEHSSLSHWKPTSAGKWRDNCSAEDSDTKDTLYIGGYCKEYSPGGRVNIILINLFAFVACYAYLVLFVITITILLTMNESLAARETSLHNIFYTNGIGM